MNEKTKESSPVTDDQKTPAAPPAAPARQQEITAEQKSEPVAAAASAPDAKQAGKPDSVTFWVILGVIIAVLGVLAIYSRWG